MCLFVGLGCALLWIKLLLGQDFSRSHVSGRSLTILANVMQEPHTCCKNETAYPVSYCPPCRCFAWSSEHIGQRNLTSCYPSCASLTFLPSHHAVLSVFFFFFSLGQRVEGDMAINARGGRVDVPVVPVRQEDLDSVQSNGGEGGSGTVVCVCVVWVLRVHPHTILECCTK